MGMVMVGDEVVVVGDGGVFYVYSPPLKHVVGLASITGRTLQNKALHSKEGG